MLRLTLLAPDITEAILDGRQPKTLELQSLLKPVPCDWAVQRKLMSLCFRKISFRGHFLRAPIKVADIGKSCSLVARVEARERPLARRKKLCNCLARDLSPVEEMLLGLG